MPGRGNGCSACPRTSARGTTRPVNVAATDRSGRSSSSPAGLLRRVWSPRARRSSVAVANAECSTVEPPPWFGRNEDELRACATGWADGVTDLQAHVNGQDVADLDAYRMSSPLFTITLPEDNVLGVESGVAEAVSEGYSFIIAPPPPGRYEIEWSAQYPGETERRAPSTVTVIVEAPQVIEPPTNTEAESTRDSAPASLAVDGSAEASSPEVEAFCTALVATENAVATGNPEVIGPAVEAVEAAAPDDETLAIVEAVSATFQAGGARVLEAYAELIDYIRANCGFAELNLTASDYVFSGFPAELPAGPIIVSRHRHRGPRTHVHQVQRRCHADRRRAICAPYAPATSGSDLYRDCLRSPRRHLCAVVRPRSGPLSRSVHLAGERRPLRHVPDGGSRSH